MHFAKTILLTILSLGAMAFAAPTEAVSAVDANAVASAAALDA